MDGAAISRYPSTPSGPRMPTRGYIFISCHTEGRDYVNDDTWVAGDTFGTTSVKRRKEFFHTFVGFADNFVVVIKS